MVVKVYVVVGYLVRWNAVLCWETLIVWGPWTGWVVYWFGYEKWMGYVLLSEGMMVYLEGVEILDEVVHVVVWASVLIPTVGVC